MNEQQLLERAGQLTTRRYTFTLIHGGDGI